MALHAKIENGSILKYPYGMGDLRSDNRNTSFPEDSFSRQDILDRYGVVEVSEVAHSAKAGYKYTETDPDGSGGIWKQSWNEEVKTVDELVDTDITKTTQPQVSRDQGLEQGTPEWDGSKWNQTWVVTEYSLGHNTGIEYIDNRRHEYGYPEDQIEFITENGLEAWQTKVAEIKAKYPKS